MSTQDYQKRICNFISERIKQTKILINESNDAYEKMQYRGELSAFNEMLKFLPRITDLSDSEIDEFRKQVRKDFKG